MPSILKSASENRQLIEQILQQFAGVLMALPNTVTNGGLLSGLTGDLLYLYQLSLYQGGLVGQTVVDEEVFNDKLEFLQESLALSAGHPNLSAGLSGQGWFLEYLNQGQGEDYDDELCEEIDNLLHSSLSVDEWLGEIELILGLGGIAIYAARRQLKSASTELFERLLSHYEQALTQISDTTSSWTQPAKSHYRFDQENPDKAEFNLGLAHGVPGIIAAILPALNIPKLHQRAKLLLQQSCDWLLEQELAAESEGKARVSCFASACGEHDNGGNSYNSGSRLGWCYGDLTIALTLSRVGKALQHSGYIEKARQISLHAATRDKTQGMVYDAGLCHGSAGLVLIFQLLDQQLNEPKLAQAANRWLDYTLDLYRQKGLEGLYAWTPLEQDYKEDTGLLMGFGGVGLCLLSALGEEADWVDCLLMA
ncbi:MAG: lantibiotic modifying enzyme [Phenylobacterium sp.]|jgi:lantibiotic modifying enzyme